MPAGNSVLDVGMLRVQDRAGILSAAEEVEVARQSEALEKATSDQLIVVTAPTLGLLAGSVVAGALLIVVLRRRE